MKLCEELVQALGHRAVFYGMPFRKRGDGQQLKRVFGLNGLWFEMETEGFQFTETLKSDQPAMTSTLTRIAQVNLVRRDTLGEMRLPRPAIVYPTTLESSSIELHDDVVEHRHLRFGNGGRGGRMELVVTALDTGKPWRRPGTTDSIAIQEYEADVRAVRDRIEDEFTARIHDLLEARRQAHEAALLAEQQHNPLWGSW